MSVADRTPARLPGRQAHAPVSRHDLSLAVENMHCGGCMRKSRRAAPPFRASASARANLAARARHRRARARPPASARPDRGARPRRLRGRAELAEASARTASRPTDYLLRRLGGRRLRRRQHHAAVGVGVVRRRRATWSRRCTALFHWLSALIALPAVAYAGQPFFRSAAQRARARAASTWTCRSRSA